MDFSTRESSTNEVTVFDPEQNFHGYLEDLVKIVGHEVDWADLCSSRLIIINSQSFERKLAFNERTSFSKCLRWIDRTKENGCFRDTEQKLIASEGFS